VYIYKIERGTDFLVVGCVSKGAILSIAFVGMSNSSQCTKSDNREFTVVPSIPSHLASAPFATPRHLCKIRTSPLEAESAKSLRFGGLRSFDAQNPHTSISSLVNRFSSSLPSRS